MVDFSILLVPGIIMTGGGGTGIRGGLIPGGNGGKPIGG